MSKNFFIIIVLFLLIVLAATFLVCMIKIDQLKQNQRNNIYSDFTTINSTDINKTETQNGAKYLDFSVYRNNLTEVDLAEYENSALVILFFNDKDEDSINTMNMMEDIYKNYADKIKFLMIDTSEEVNREFESEYTLEIFYDFYKEAVRKYGSRDFTEFEIPTIIYINSSNEIFNTKTGLTSYDALEANLDILAENY